MEREPCGCGLVWAQALLVEGGSESKGKRTRKGVDQAPSLWQQTKERHMAAQAARQQHLNFTTVCNGTEFQIARVFLHVCICGSVCVGFVCLPVCPQVHHW